jgi:hypothetical protein
MSLERFTNKDDILSIDGVTRGIVWKKEDIELLSLDTKGITPEGSIEVEVHVYSKTGGYINSVLPSDFTIRENKLYVNYIDTLNTLGIRRGEFEVVTNIHQPVLGNFNDRLLQLKEISPDRREVLVSLIPVVSEKIPDYETLIQDYLNEYTRVYDQDLAINFGKNNVFKVINHKGWDTNNELVIRLYNPLPDDIVLNSTFWIVEELADSYIDNVNLTIPLPADEVNHIKGPNFDIDEGAAVITETEFKSWNDLLDANLSTSQQVLDRMFSGSLSGVPLGIDYSAFDNFIFYSSAYERLANFKYKLELLEFYNNRISVLDNALGSDSGSLTNNIINTQKRIDNIIGSFDGFERWLYYEPTGSLTTHGVSGSYLGSDGYTVTTWPKYLSNSSYIVHTPSSTIARNWFATASANAIFYDELNVNALAKTIPEHIRVDPNNSEYELFVNMIGHHFDILYSYIDALSRNYRNEEHPKLGVGRDTLYDIAKSMGWTLTNGNQATALWKYKLGVDTDGKYQSTGSLFSKSNEEITTEVWRRIVNNLPYLLKTKGTARSIKALMACYGIPQTLLSIREYGGPLVSGDAPNIIENRYAYMLAVNNDSNPAIENGVTSVTYTPPAGAITRELRFRTISGSNMQLFSGGGSTIDLEYFSSGLFSGSNEYGRVKLNTSIVTPWAPIFDGDIWNVRWWSTGGTGRVQVQRASDHFVGRVSHQVSASGVASAFTTAGATIAGGFTGYIQEFREWTEVLSQATFNDHTLNPTSYASSANVTGSYTTLQVHYTLGSDGNAYDHNAATTISSSHPNRSYTGRNGTAVGAVAPPDPQIGNYLGTEEVYYIQGISLGGNLPRSQKIRLEDNFLIRKLSPVNTGERSSYDYAPIDNNKLGLFYSHADQINKDIFDQFGDGELDEFMGDPQDEFETEYKTLRHISDKYWQKYINRNDVNAYIRIFSQFDFSLFSQIKQLIPLRANLAAGVLVEPHALERAKVQITKRPQVENPQYDTEIPQPENLLNAEYSQYTASIPMIENILQIESNYHSGSSGYSEDGNTWFANFDLTTLISAQNLYSSGTLDDIDVGSIDIAGVINVENVYHSGSNNGYDETGNTWFGDINLITNILSAQSIYHTGSNNGYSEAGNAWFANLGGTPNTGAMDYCTINVNDIGELPIYTASYSQVFSKDTGTDITNTDWSIAKIKGTSTLLINDYDAIRYITGSDSLWIQHAKSTGTQTTNELYCVVNVSREYPIECDITLRITEQYDNNIPSSTTRTVRLVSIDNENNINVELARSTQSVTLFNGTDTNTTLVFNDIHIPSYNRFVILITYTVSGLGSTTIELRRLVPIIRIKKVCHSHTLPIIDSFRPSNIYQRIVYYYSGSNVGESLPRRNALHAASQSLGLYYKREYVTAAYFDDVLTQYENSTYTGTRISAPGINLPITTENATAIAGTPVIEVYETNANQLIFTRDPSSRGGTGNTEPGNLLVR